MEKFNESVKYEVVVGVPDNKQVSITSMFAEVDGILLTLPQVEFELLDQIKLRWQEHARIFNEVNGVYISAIAVPGHAIYHKDWGCPTYGERVIAFNCTANPEFIKDMDKYEEGVLYIAKKLKKDFKQHTITITKLKADMCYLTDKDNEEA